jgi:glycosyltransferase involved in cell wall biosynthesis
MSASDAEIEVSAIMPCLNEEETIGTCIQKATKTFEELGVRGEIVVGDNGSSDRSVELAEALGARVVHEPVKGYGAALKAAIGASRGRYCIMADCDDSYDWKAIGPFIEKLREGNDLVMGTRLKGTILPGAMPPLHRLFGNPFLSGTMNLFFRTGVSDAYCGMRGFTRDAYEDLGVRAEGMEFAIEMVVKAANRNLKIAEIPITLYADGRSGPPHLRSFRDGWRTLKLLLFYAPDWLYAIPGALLLGIGTILQGILIGGPVSLAGFYVGIHWLALGCLLTLMGFQILCLGAFAKAFAMNESFEMRGRLFKKFFESFTVERGIFAGSLLIWLGLLVDVAILFTWLATRMGPLGSTHIVFVATTVIAMGVQLVFGSFFLGMLRIGTSEPPISNMRSG